MSLEIERRISDSPSTPEQLRHLAAVGVKSAVERDRFRTLSRKKGVHYFVDELDEKSFYLEDEYMPVHLRRRISTRVGVRPPNNGLPKIWTLKMFDTYFARSMSGQWLGERSTYRFEWTRSRTIMADRVMKLVGFSEENTHTDNPLEQYLDNFKVGDDAATITGVIDDLRMVTSDDLWELQKEIQVYIDALVNNE